MQGTMMTAKYASTKLQLLCLAETVPDACEWVTLNVCSL